MKTKDNKGNVPIAGIIAFFLGVMLIGASVFGVWAYSERAKYADDFDAKVATEIEAQKKQIQIQLQSDFDIKEQQPYKDFSSDSEYGSITVSVPKNWSILSDKPAKSGIVLDATLHPNVIPGISTGIPYAARINLISDDYATVVKSYDESIKKSTVTVTAFEATNVPGSTDGIRLDGQILSGKTGTMVILKVRDKTLKIWNESPEHRQEFDQILLGSLTYNP
jgi:hypothetical protein